MTDNTQNEGREADQPTTDELEEPSIEKEPGDEPKGDTDSEPEHSHQAVGIGVIPSGDPADSSGAAAGDASGDDSGDTEQDDPPSPAMSDEVGRAAADASDA
ncbi:hypothetical protein [Microbacterium hominis]|uniref:Uncharacterized protein n=1 Tax=Microbacterium hominis TaxID=162426 RepID=A0A7D4PNC4_9MICO|nr:hypothetical protein [Microbacterium hominis]QKJ20190.1 hypothetical protein HQM25_13015 [Microbacterium hominis]